MTLLKMKMGIWIALICIHRAQAVFFLFVEQFLPEHNMLSQLGLFDFENHLIESSQLTPKLNLKTKLPG